MEESFFALAPNDGHIFASPKSFKIANLVDDLATTLKQASRFSWAAFGPGKENYVVTCATAGVPFIHWGDDTPEALVAWLAGPQKNRYLTDASLRVALGPDGSFFAWDSNRVRWHNIPPGLERAVQSWLGPSGWNCGAPRIVTLGTKGSYFAISEYGHSAWSIPSGLKTLSTAFEKLKREKIDKTFDWPDLEYFYIDSTEDDRFVFCRKGGRFNFELPYSAYEPFYDVYETLLDEDVVARWRSNREKSRRDEESEKARQAEEKRKQEQDSRAKDARERARRDEERATEDLQLKYVVWHTALEADIVKKRVLTVFPHLPMTICTCREASCLSRKVPGSLMACQHDVERFFRASGSYSLSWLRKERLAFHPDRFGLRCDLDFRIELKKKATEFYAIFEVLIEAEKESSGDGRESL